MRKVLISLGIASVALAAVPAAAQGYGYNNNGYDNGPPRGNGNGQYRDGARQELWQLSQRVDRAHPERRSEPPRGRLFPPRDRAAARSRPAAAAAAATTIATGQ